MVTFDELGGKGSAVIFEEVREVLTATNKPKRGALLNLNESVLAMVLEHLSLNDLVALDSALTNHVGRGHYLTALSRVDAGELLVGLFPE